MNHDDLIIHSKMPCRPNIILWFWWTYSGCVCGDFVFIVFDLKAESVIHEISVG